MPLSKCTDSSDELSGHAVGGGTSTSTDQTTNPKHLLPRLQEIYNDIGRTCLDSATTSFLLRPIRRIGGSQLTICMVASTLGHVVVEAICHPIHESSEIFQSATKERGIARGHAPLDRLFVLLRSFRASSPSETYWKYHIPAITGCRANILPDLHLFEARPLSSRSSEPCMILQGTPVLPLQRLHSGHTLERTTRPQLRRQPGYLDLKLSDFVWTDLSKHDQGDCGVEQITGLGISGLPYDTLPGNVGPTAPSGFLSFHDRQHRAARWDEVEVCRYITDSCQCLD